MLVACRAKSLQELFEQTCFECLDELFPLLAHCFTLTSRSWVTNIFFGRSLPNLLVQGRITDILIRTPVPGFAARFADARPPRAERSAGTVGGLTDGEKRVGGETDDMVGN